MSSIDLNSQTNQSNIQDGIPIKWYYLKSLSKMFEKDLTESEDYLQNQIGSASQNFIREKDISTLKYLKDFIPNMIGLVGSVIAGGCLYSHYIEVDKHYTKQALEKEVLLKSNPNSQNLFPAKNMEGSTIPFKQISKFQQKLRILVCMGFFFVAGYANGYANYKYNLINMNDIYYAKQYELIKKQPSLNSKSQ